MLQPVTNKVNDTNPGLDVMSEWKKLGLCFHVDFDFNLDKGSLQIWTALPNDVMRLGFARNSLNQG